MKELVAIVTGASQGIGRATAVRLAKDFAGIALAARNGEALKEVAAKVRSSGADPLTFSLDLRERESAEILVKKTLDRFGRIDVEPLVFWFNPFVFQSQKVLSSWYSEERLAMIFLRASSATGVRQYTYKS